MAKPKFPEEMFISEQGREGETFWACSEEEVDAIEDDGPTFVAKYKLVSVTKLAKVAQVVGK